MGLFMVSFTAGFGIGALLGGLLKDTVGVEATFLALAGAAFLALLLVTTLMPSLRGSQDSEGSKIPSIRVMVNDFRVLALFTFNFTFGLSMGSVMTFIAIFMTDSLLASATLVGLVVGSRAVVSSIFQPLFGRLADHAPRHAMVAIGGVLMAAATGVIPLAPSVGTLVLIFLVLGLAESAAQPASLAITTDLGRIYGYGTLIGLSNAILVFGLLVGSLGSSLIEAEVGMENMFMVVAFFMALMLGVFLAMWGRGTPRATQLSAADQSEVH